MLDHDHSPEAIRERLEGGPLHRYTRDWVYGGIDGSVTTFAVVAGVVGASLSPAVILIIGMANILADGFSMATGAYLSTKSEQEYYLRERQRESWEVEHFPDGERIELLELYRKRGYSEKEARTLVEIQSREPKRWVDAMMVDELGMLPDERKPLISALATLVSFIVVGSIPLLAYLVGLIIHFRPNFRWLRR